LQLEVDYLRLSLLTAPGSAQKAIEVLKASNVPEKNIFFLNLIASPEGIKSMRENFPEVTIVTTAIDKCLNEKKFISPG
jgi:uracil phosphoribosyltransferase